MKHHDRKWSVYRIDFPDSGQTYVGITCTSLEKRLHQHSVYSQAVNMKLFRLLYAGKSHNACFIAENLPYTDACAMESRTILDLRESGVSLLNCYAKDDTEKFDTFTPQNLRRRKRNVAPTERDLRCSLCHVTKPGRAFDPDRSRYSGRHSQCKDCRKRKQTELKAKLMAQHPPDGKKKGLHECVACLTFKPETDFYFALNRNGVNARCKDCMRNKRKSQKSVKRAERREKRLKKVRVSGTCHADGCDRPMYARHLCRNCYQKNLKERKKVGDYNSHYATKSSVCMMAHCDRTSHARGLCNTCYRKHRREVLCALDMEAFRCREAGCENPEFSRGLCPKHYYRIVRSKAALEAAES